MKNILYADVNRLLPQEDPVYLGFHIDFSLNELM
jgi:hypothetical protein